VNVGWGFVNVWALRGSGGVALIDAHYPGHEDRILRRLEHRGIDADDVTVVVVTHAHSDHLGSAAALAVALDVPVWIGAADTAVAASGHHPEGNVPATGSRGRLLSFMAKPTFPPVTVGVVGVAGEQSLAPLGIDARVWTVGGHTPGSLVVETADRALFVGDLLRSSLTAHRDPELHLFHDDPLGAHAALATVVTPGVAAVYPGHGGPMPTPRVARWLERRRPKVDERWTDPR
jgi:hydroxyacylglutathione hydrolase